MEVVVTGRHCEVSDRFREHVSEKLARLEKHDHRIIRVQVEVEQEKNPRQHDRATQVELTAFSKGPVIRAEAAAEDKMGALDLALDKMAVADAPRRRPPPRAPADATPPSRSERPWPACPRRSTTPTTTPTRPSPNARSDRSRSPATDRWSCARSRTRPRR